MAIEFNTQFYIQSKFNQLEAEGLLESFGLTDVESLAQYFADNGVDAQAHYLSFGMAEGINPSPEFDTNAYLEAKLAQLQGEQFEGQYADLTIEGLIEIFQDRGLTPLDHYNQYGINENITAEVPAEAVEGAAFALTTGTDTLVAADAELEEGEEAVRTTALNDTISGTVSALSSERTLNATDSIDGGAGEDTLALAMNTGFTGFTGNGGVQNVETIALTNTGSIARTFNATGVEGVETYQLNGAVNLAGVAAADALISVADRTANLSVTFTDEAVKGKEDTLSLAVENTGSFEEDGSVDAAMGITANGIENVTVAATGENAINLSGTNAKTLTFTGTGSIALTDVANSGLTSVDASALEGSADLNLTSIGGLTVKSVLTGASDDVIRIQAGNDVAANATINGGEGNDRVVLSGGTATTQYLMSGIETLALETANTGNLTFSALNTTGLETIEATADFLGSATFARLGSADLAFALVGDNTDADSKITTDHSGVATVNVTSEEDGDSHNTDLTFTNANTLLLNVAEDSIYNGTIIANKAQSIEADIAGQLNSATLTATGATSAVFSTGEETTTLAQLNAAKLVDLNVTAAGSFTVNGGDLSGLEALTIATEGTFDSHGVSMAAIAQLALSGSGSVNLGNLGDTRDTYGITLNAEGLNNGLQVGSITTDGTNININAADVLGTVNLGAIDAGAGNVTVDVSEVNGAVTLTTMAGRNVTVDASDALNGVTYGEITVTNSATINGATLSNNTATVNTAGTSFTGVLNGGIGEDAYTVNVAETTTTLNLSGDLDIQGDGENDSVEVSIATGATTAYTATYKAQGVEELTFRFVDTDDVVTLTAGSSLAGVNTLEVIEGTVDVTAAGGFEGQNLIVGSGVRMTTAQFASITSIDAQDADAEISIEINSVEEAQRVAEVFESLATGTIKPSFRLFIAQAIINEAEVTTAISSIATSGDANAVFQEEVATDGSSTPTGKTGPVNLADARLGNLADGQYDIVDTLVEILKENVSGSPILANARTITAEDLNGNNGYAFSLTDVSANAPGAAIDFTANTVSLTLSEVLTIAGIDTAQYSLNFTADDVITVTGVTVAQGDFVTGRVMNELSDNDTISFSENAATLDAINFTSVFTTTNVKATSSDTITIKSLNSATVEGSEAKDIFTFANGDTGVTIAEFGTAGADQLNMSSIVNLIGIGINFDGTATAMNGSIISQKSATQLTASNVQSSKFEATGGMDLGKMVLAEGEQVLFVNQDDDGVDFGAQVFLVKGVAGTVTAELVTTLAGINDLAYEDFVTTFPV